MAHNQKHALLGPDHLPGTPPASGSGKLSMFGTNENSTLDQVLLEAVNQATPQTGEIVRRQAGAHILLPATNAVGNQAISYSQAQTLLAGGLYRGAVDHVVPDHSSSELTGLRAGMLVIETGDSGSSESVWRVVNINTGTTGDTATWADEGVPNADVIYINMDSGSNAGQWMYSVERGVWISLGASTHNRSHDITSGADHTVPVNSYGIVFTSNGGVNILSMVSSDLGAPTVPRGAPVLSNGNGEPIYGALLLADGVYPGSTAEPTANDVLTWPNNCHGIVRTTSGRYLVFKEDASVIFCVELGQA